MPSLRRCATRIGTVFTAAMAGLSALPATAQSALPDRLKPERPAISRIVGADDEFRLRRGLREADRANWFEVRQLAAQMDDPTGARILLWRAATSDVRSSFDELNRALDLLGADWPNAVGIRQDAEAAIADAGLSAADVVAWFERYPPTSGDGSIALADALFSVGRVEEADTLLRETWRTRRLSRDVQDRTVRRYRSRLTREDHEARTDLLLWIDFRSSAWALRDQVSPSWRSLMLARIRLRGRQRGVDAAVAAVPAALRDHPGLLFERARWRRRAGRRSDALPLLLQIQPPISHIAAEVIWTERRIHVGYALRRSDYDTAYALASNHGLEEGAQFADAEWLAGWLALQKLGQAEQAYAHFVEMEGKVSTPISKGRGLYWMGRAAEAMGDRDLAQQHYIAAADYPTVYYGQLAIERLDNQGDEYRLPTPVEPTPEQRAAFEDRDLVRALIVLAELDEVDLFRRASYYLDDKLENPAHIALLGDIALDFGQPGFAVRAAKAGVLNGVFETDTAYPILELPPLDPISPEPAFIYALMRQESEFYPRAVSGANAQGIMQLLPATALGTARRIGESYRRNWLVDDVEYNIRIGSAHLGELVNSFDGSYILAAAAYNAGPRRARQWVRDYGDPRDPSVDPIDWVESIPFRETRNYVQRLLEATQVYRGRLNGGVLDVRLTADLRRGG